MISIITVCYNAELQIEKTIQSVLRQTYKNYEYIFVDGESTDCTLEIIRRYASEFAKQGITVKLISERDSGIYDAMNKGIKMADGEWINLLNAGDCYHDDKVLERMQIHLEQSIDIVVGEIVNVEGFLGKRYYHSAIEDLKSRMIFCHQAVFAAKKLYKEKEFDISYRYSADYDWLLYMYLNGCKYKCVDVVVADYDSEGVSNQNCEKTIAESKQIRVKNGGEDDIEEIDQESAINWKYKLYKVIAYHKILAKIYYNICGKRREDTYWMEK